MSLNIYNTLSRASEPFTPIEPGHVRMYVCGMTIYDLCHIGHARMMMAFDVVHRWLVSSGFRVTYVRNITDIDDKIIKRAVERGMTIRALTDEMIAAMHEDIGRLGILAPTVEPRATEYVTPMLELIAKLEAKGLAYKSNSGDVLYAVRKFAGYGKLSGKSLDELRAGERVAVADGKEDPLDFVLWKSAKTSEPADAKWNGVVGEQDYGVGRPGWHIECSAMSCKTLGETFDIHGGGADLQFPHHENEIAQSEGANDRPLAQFWLHNGFVRVDNEKMSKSLGNFFTIREVLAKFDAETVRFFLVRTHYRTALNYSDVHLNDARQALKRLYTALDAVPPCQQAQAIEWSNPYAAKFRAAMDEDFGTPEAIAVLFDLATEVNKTKSPDLSWILKSLGNCLGLLQGNPGEFLQTGAAVDASVIQAQIEMRNSAKLAKDFAAADAIRRELLLKGIVLKDTAAGTSWEVAA
ncbi:cysteine--tRNA ligase [Rhodoferax aquaticus]|uniref:Cysteine--tRNA ligase n=1 Tax=Rhodoferax aquaticus TaxID=2527691 RepID=A0A515ENN8_9BURK|nr:cysteine--tRNA ligase [Rhodoferax aquaticus]QDL54248.1 cysteine--tRNA ligase [Rhodoferax aquaticus]